MESVLTTNKLTKRFGKQTAVNEINIAIPRGAIYGLVGRNGAGKTSLMKMICGLSHPTSGSFSLFGAENSKTQKSELYSQVGSLIETLGFFENMSACLSQTLAEAKDATKLHRFLGTLLSTEMTRQEKKDIIENEYNIPMNENIERKVNNMCNLSDLVEESGIKRGIEIGRKDGISEGIRAMIEVCQELGASRADTLYKVISKFSLSSDEVEELMELYW